MSISHWGVFDGSRTNPRGDLAVDALVLLRLGAYRNARTLSGLLMIRDPSDGSVKPIPQRPTSAENWGMKSLDQPPKVSAFKPMTPEQLTDHYAKHNLGFQPKEQGEQ